MEDIAPQKKRSSKERWAILRRALLEKKATAENFQKGQSLGLIKETTNHVFEFEGIQLKIYPPKLDISHTTLTGFNNTGNVRIWAAEEAMVDYVHKHVSSEKLKTAIVLELGGGFANLCGQFIAKRYPLSYSYLTDGNLDSVKHCSSLTVDNGITNNTSCQVLRWDQPSSFKLLKNHTKQLDCNNNDKTSKSSDDTYNIPDIILIADCFFFDEYRKHLINCVMFYLNQNSNTKVIVMGPSRNGTYEDFLKGIQQKFQKKYPSSNLCFSEPTFYPQNQNEIMLSVLN